MESKWQFYAQNDNSTTYCTRFKQLNVRGNIFFGGDSSEAELLLKILTME